MPVEVTWWGHATATLRDSGTSLLTDPLVTRFCGPLYRRRGPLPPAAALAADAVLVSHLHADHLHLPSLERVAVGTLLLVPRGALRAMPRLRQVTRRLVVAEVTPGDTVPVGGLTVRVVPAAHDGRRLPFGPRRVSALGYVVEGEARTYFAGDTELYAAMPRETGRVDVAVLPVGGWGPRLGRGHLDAERAAQALARVRPRAAVPVHYGTYWPTGLAAVRPHAFHSPGEEFARHAARLAPGVEVHVLTHGETARPALTP